MKILQIANGYLGNKLYRNLFAEQAENGIENTVYVPLKKGEAHPAGEPQNVVFSNCFTQIDRVMFFSKQRKMLRDLEQMELSSFALSHAHTVFSGGYAAYRLYQKYGLPYIVAVRNTDVNVFFRYMVHLRKTGVEILRNAKKIIFLSPAYRENVLAKYVPEQYREEVAEKSLVIPNGIAGLFFEKKGEAKQLLSKDQIRLIHVGDVNSNKNPELTAAAAKLLKEQGMSVDFRIVGPVKEQKYQEIIRQTDFITHYERCPLEQVLEHLRTADIFVMPSHTETFGLVYAEAMSQGLPVIYTRGQGFDGQFPEGTVGYGVSDRDAEELAEKIRRIMENYDELSANCVTMVDKFSWKDIAGQYKEIYREIKR